MKVLMVLDEEFPPDVRVEKELAALRDSGHTLHLLCYTRTGQPDHEHLQGTEVHRVALPAYLYKMKALALELPLYFRFWKKHILRRLEKEPCDLIHFHDLNLASVCLEIGREKGIQVIGDYHENRPEIMNYYHHVRTFPGNLLISSRRWAKFQEKYTRQLDHLILVTGEAKEYYADHYGIQEDRITVVENYPDLDELMRFRADKAIVDRYNGRRMLLYFGDTGIRRGTLTILEAALRLKEDPRYCFVIIGTSREQGELTRFRDEQKLENVELTGMLPLQEAVSYFRAAWAGLSPLLRNTHHDTTYANKLFQYMAFGMPVIVSDCPAQGSVVEISRSGLVHQAGNAADLADKIRMLDDPRRHKTLGSNAAEAVKINYNFTTSGKKLVHLYDQIAHDIQRDQQA